MSQMTIRFLADANFNLIIVRGLLRLQPAIDILTAHEANLKGVADPEVLAFAARQQRILVSHDRRTMPDHFSAFLSDGMHSPGVFLFLQNIAPRIAIEALHLIWHASTQAEWIDHLEYLPWQ